jgi:hypothetical protein
VTDKTSNLEVELLSNTAARPYTVLAPIAMKNIKKNYCSIFEIKKETQTKASPSKSILTAPMNLNTCIYIQTGVQAFFRK